MLPRRHDVKPAGSCLRADAAGVASREGCERLEGEDRHMYEHKSIRISRRLLYVCSPFPKTCRT